MVRQEWKKLFHNRILLLVVIAVIAIPSIYTTLFLGSMWDPYGKADQLPVAVVNKDQAVFYEGKELKIGEELTEKLKEDDSLDFCFTDEKTANRWLADGKCYMVLTIPENFSANAATVTSENPKKMELSYETNPGTNYIASKMSETAMKSMENSVREKVTSVYTKVMFASIREAGDGMAAAADGSGQLADGTKEAVSGSDQLTENLGTLAKSTLTFQNGEETLTEGLKAYTQAAEAAGDGAHKIDAGAGKLADAAGQLADGTGSLKNGIDTLNGGLQAIVGENHRQSQTLAEGSRSLSEGISAFSGALSQMPASSDLSVYAQQMKEASAALGNVPSVTDPSYLTGQIEAAAECRRYGTAGKPVQARLSGRLRPIIKVLRPWVDRSPRLRLSFLRRGICCRRQPIRQAVCRHWHLRQKYWKKSQPLWQMACRHTQKEWIRRQTAVQLLHQGWKPTPCQYGRLKMGSGH